MTDDEIIRHFHDNGVTVIKDELMVSVGRAIVNAKVEEMNNTAARLMALLTSHENINELLNRLEEGIKDGNEDHRYQG